MKQRRTRFSLIVVGSVAILVVGLGSAWAQIAVTDPATTARNAVVAVLKDQILGVVGTEQERLRSMARRLSAATNLDKYATPSPEWAAYDDELMYADPYRRAFRDGDPTGDGYAQIARTRQVPTDSLARLNPAAREVVERALATLDGADSTIVSGTNQAGVLRVNARREQVAVDALEADVINPSEEQSATAVLDKISGATLIEARQKEARLQLLTGIVEQLLVDGKRARDAETGLLNMQLNRLRLNDVGEDGAMLTGAADDLRTWRQP
jgi:hypothetical protein